MAEDLTIQGQFIVYFIPALEKMVEKEKIHLKFLKIQLRHCKSRNSVMSITDFIETSEKYLLHYEQRIRQYKDYAYKIPTPQLEL